MGAFYATCSIVCFSSLKKYLEDPSVSTHIFIVLITETLCFDIYTLSPTLPPSVYRKIYKTANSNPKTVAQGGKQLNLKYCGNAVRKNSLTSIPEQIKWLDKAAHTLAR